MNEPQRVEKSRFTIELDVVGPLMTRSIEARHFSEDLLGLTVNNRPALPGTLVKGVFRSALTQVLEALSEDETGARDDLDRLLHRCFGPRLALAVLEGDQTTTGSEAADQDWEPERGALNFAAYWTADETKAQSATLSRIEIDAASGTVEPGALVVARSPLQPGQRATFKGDVETWLPVEEVEAFRKWIAKAAQLVGAVGSMTSVGFGKVTAIRIGEREATPESHAEKREAGPSYSKDLQFGLALEFDRPFCFARPKGRGNVLESQPFVPGGAIIGAVAELLATQGTAEDDLLKNNLHAIHVTHALAAHRREPGDEAFRASPIPLSVAMTEQGPVDDADTADNPDVLPVFAPDWKAEQRERVIEKLPDFESVPLEHVTIVRNAIDPESGAAAEAALFAFDAIDPKDREWRCNVTIDADAVEGETDPRQVLDRFRTMVEYGILGLGKTKARAAVEVVPPWEQAFSSKGDLEAGVRAGKTLRMLLITDADLLGVVDRLPGTGGAQELRNLYQDYFDRSFGTGRLRLENWYTIERLAGGRYIHSRFWSRKRNGENGDAPERGRYRPHVMTGAGSVFALQVSNDLDETSLGKLRKELGRARRFGLTPGPLLSKPDDATTETRQAWKHHPWLPAQGYGEILLQPALGLRKTAEDSDGKT